MFSLREQSPTDILASTLYDEAGFYPAFMRDLKYCRKEVIIESPYMTSPRVAT